MDETHTWTSSKLVKREPRDDGVFRVSAEIMFSCDLKHAHATRRVETSLRNSGLE